MTRLLLIGDVHLSDHPPSIRTDDYCDDIFAKLEFAVERANAMEVDAIVQAGDLFHVKAPSRTSHKLVQRAADVFGKSNAPVLVVPGNHDMQNDRIKSLSMQPLGTLCKAPGIDMLMGPHPTLPVFGVPYLFDWPVMLPKFATAFGMWSTTNAVKDLVPLLVTHAPIFPDDEHPPYDYITASDWAAKQKTGDCYYGHIHDPHGTYVSGSVVFCNQGALSRGSLHEATLKRKPAITLWDNDEVMGRFARIEVPHRPVEEVFRLAKKEDVDKRQERVTEFLDGVEKTVLQTLTVEEVLHHAEGMQLRDRTLSEIRSVIEEASTR